MTENTEPVEVSPEKPELENSNDEQPTVTETEPVEVVPEQPVASPPVPAGYNYPDSKEDVPVDFDHQPLGEAAHGHVQSETPDAGFPTSPPEMTDLPTVDGVREVDPEFEADGEAELEASLPEETATDEAGDEAPEAPSADETPEENA